MGVAMGPVDAITVRPRHATEALNVDWQVRASSQKIINCHYSGYCDCPMPSQCKKAVLSQGEPRDAAVNFDKYRILQ